MTAVFKKGRNKILHEKETRESNESTGSRKGRHEENSKACVEISGIH